MNRFVRPACSIVAPLDSRHRGTSVASPQFQVEAGDAMRSLSDIDPEQAIESLFGGRRGLIESASAPDYNRRRPTMDTEDLRAQVAGIRWYHTTEMRPGVTTLSVAFHLDRAVFHTRKQAGGP